MNTYIQSTLEFNLHTQCFIEKIRTKDYMGAIQYAQRFLVESEGMSKEKLQETMVLLAFKPSTECEKYKVSGMLAFEPSTECEKYKVSGMLAFKPSTECENVSI